MIKNVANQTVDFLLLSTTDGSAVTTGTPAVYYKGDGGTQTVGTGTISHKGLGEWEYIPVQAETNFNHIVFLATLTGAFSQAVNIYTKTGDAYTAVAALHDPDTASIAAAVLDGVLTDLTDNSLNSGQTITLRKAIRAVFNRFFREVTQTASTQIVKNDAGSQVAVMTVSDDATTQIKGSAS